jgi:hypothetical protein
MGALLDLVAREGDQHRDCSTAGASANNAGSHPMAHTKLRVAPRAETVAQERDAGLCAA